MAIMTEAKRKILNVNQEGRIEALINVVRGRGTLKEIVSRLKQKGERLTKDDLATQHGPIGQLFHKRGSKAYSAMNIIDELMEELLKHGEVIHAADFIQSTSGSGQSALDWAAKKNVLKKIFQPRLWINRVEDMEYLWENVPNHGKSQVQNYDEIRSQVMRLSKPEFKIPHSLRKHDLFQKDEDGLSPLDDHRTWKNWDRIASALDRVVAPEMPTAIANAFSEIAPGIRHLTKKELMKPGDNGKPYIQIAAEAGVLHKVGEYLAEKDDPLTREDLINAGLESFAKDADKQLHKAALDGDDENLQKLANGGVADIESRQGKDGYTPAMVCASKGHSNGVWTLLLAGADPDARTGKNQSVSLLWLSAKHADDTAVSTVISGLKEKYGEDALGLLGALTTINSSVTPAQAARDVGHSKSSDAIEKAVDEVANVIADLPLDQLGTSKVNGKSALDLLITASRLKSVFTSARWNGNPRGMQEMAGQIPKEELDKQLSGKDGTPTYGQILSQVNAGTIKGMSQRTFEIV